MEAKIESYLRVKAIAAGGLALKWVSPSRAGVPDRIILLPIPPEHRQIVNRYLKLAEVKSPGKKPTPIQEATHCQLRNLGYDVAVPDSKEAVDAIFS
jgi:hypothetical protein